MKPTFDELVGVFKRRRKTALDINNFTVDDVFVYAARANEDRRFKSSALVESRNQFTDKCGSSRKWLGGLESREHVIVRHACRSWPWVRVAPSKNKKWELFRHVWLHMG